MKVECTFVEELLGTLAGNPEIATEHILANNPDGVAEDEEGSLSADEQLEKATTIFPRDENGNPFMWDYQVRGFFKAAASALNRASKAAERLAAHKKIIDQCIFVNPRKIPLILPEGIEQRPEGGPLLTFCERPLRAQTAQGERVALARSEAAPIGTKIEFEVCVLGGQTKWDTHIEAWLDYGRWSGFLQWRNGGKGRFTHRILD